MIVFPVDSAVKALDDDGLPIYDRPFVSQDIADVYETFFSNGVFMNKPSSLQVMEDTENSGMTVLVSPGKCHIDGRFGVEVEQRTMTFEAANATMDRIDSVVVRLNLNREARSCELYVKKGTAAAQPSRPALMREGSIYELGIADVFISVGQTSIMQAKITDTRLDNTRCGMVVPFVEIDTESISNAIDLAVKGMLQESQERTDAALDGLEETVTSSIDKLKEMTDIAVSVSEGALSETLAGDMALQINAMYHNWDIYKAEMDVNVPLLVQTTLRGIFDAEY